MPPTNSEEWTREDSERVAEGIRPIVELVLRLDRDDLVQARQELATFEAAGPIMDPTAWQENRETNKRAIERLDALIEFYDALNPDDVDPAEVEEVDLCE